MSQTTKKALASSLKHLMEKKSLSKITIADITEDCGINRMTFYYHFQDIYDLIDWICHDEFTQVIHGGKTYQTWQEGFIALCYAIIENRVFIEGVYHSVQREQVKDYLYSVIYSLIFDVIVELSKGYSISHENQEYIANFYKYALAGVLLEWVKHNFEETPDELVNNLSILVHGQLLSAIENMSDYKLHQN